MYVCMYPPLAKLILHNKTLTFYSHLLHLCLSSKSVNLTKLVHAQLFKVGFNSHTFLGNRILELYTQFHLVDDILKSFSDITRKNTISWNICLKGLLNCGYNVMAHSLFRTMPQPDVVTCNTLISYYVSCKNTDNFVWEAFREMLCMGVNPSCYTYSILVSFVLDDDPLLGKELHGSMIRSGLITSNVVLGNSLIHMYTKMGLLDYAFGVFSSMEFLDLVSWNSLIIGFCKGGYCELAFGHFSKMRYLGYALDEFTCSALITCCNNLRDLCKGKQIFALSTKLGFLCNSVILSAFVDLFSKCNRLEHSVQLFEQLDRFDSAVCNSMISSYTAHDFNESAIQLLVLMLRQGIRPTEFTLSTIVASISGIQADQGTQIHSLVVKFGFEMDFIICSSLVHMYATLGLIDCAIDIFQSIALRDLACWNTMIWGLTLNGRLVEAIDTFKLLQTRGLLPDQISLTGVLRACSYGGFVDEGTAIFSTMEENYGVRLCYEHYAYLVDLLCLNGRLDDAMEIIAVMPYEPNFMIWESLLNACAIHGDVNLAETVAERLMELEPQLSLPYIVMSRIYEMRGQWEETLCVRKAMKRNVVKHGGGCSWIVIKNHVYSFTSEYLQQHAARDIYSLLRLLTWEKSENMPVEAD